VIPDIKQHYQDEDIARSYDRERFSDPVGRAFDRLEKRALRRVLRGVIREMPRPTVLDIPCGTGRITEVLLDLGLEVVGGDISKEMMDVAREQCDRFGERVSFRQLDLDGLDLPDNRFDLVTCIRLLHHLETEDRGPILRELARVSRRYVLVNIAYSSPFYRLRRRLKRALGQGVSRSSSTREEIRREAATAGLELAGMFPMARWASENVFLLLKKSASGQHPKMA
jgi:ubiquinone/menaquinone biosynthesis C-methylase UbiE